MLRLYKDINHCLTWFAVHGAFKALRLSIIGCRPVCVMHVLRDLQVMTVVISHWLLTCLCHACLTWFACDDGGPGGLWASAGAVVGQHDHVVEGAGPQAGHSGAGLQPGRTHAVSCRLPLMLPPVPDLDEVNR